jgi:DNA recombination protein RmuC
MEALWFAGGLLTGGLLVYLVTRRHNRDTERAFAALSLEALRKNSEDFLKLAGEALSRQSQAGAGDLEGKKKLIDQTLEVMTGELQRVKQCVADFDNKSEQKFGKVSEQLRLTAEQTGKLQDTTNKLQSTLGSNKERGQWGERMAEDVLRFCGFVEGINYLKQQTQQECGSRPDFTFLLPEDMKLNMDVKFPLSSYSRYVNEEAEAAREIHRQQFLRDVRSRIKEVTTRDYINPREKTLDYVLVFVPNEQVYGFIHQQDGSLMDEALKSRVVLCSPLTLYAILSVIRKAVDNFALSKAAASILEYMGEFEKQWQEFKKCMDGAGRHIDAAQTEFQKLTTTRSRMLERSLGRIDDLRAERKIWRRCSNGHAFSGARFCRSLIIPKMLLNYRLEG